MELVGGSSDVPACSMVIASPKMVPYIKVKLSNREPISSNTKAFHLVEGPQAVDEIAFAAISNPSSDDCSHSKIDTRL